MIKRLLRKLPIWLLLISVTVQSICAETVVRHPVGRTEGDHRYEYMVKLLKFLLDKTLDTHGEYRLAPTTGTNQDRMIFLVAGGHLDVAQLPISAKANERLEPVRFPIRRGLLGWRILLIRKQDQEVFAKVKNLNELKTLVAGFGMSWGDLPILELNVGKNRVVTSNSYEGLFEMLIRQRFDYLHRGLHEPWAEVEGRKEKFPELWIEQTLVLHYPIDDYLYVSKNNPMLADRLRAGFRRALKDGSFERFFNDEFGLFIDKANIPERTLIKFSNPSLPADSSVNDESLWVSFPTGSR